MIILTLTNVIMDNILSLFRICPVYAEQLKAKAKKRGDLVSDLRL